jgi:hypothetical protein
MRALQRRRLTRDVPELWLKCGDIVELVDHHVARGRSKGYSIELFNAVGETIAVTAVPEAALETLREDGNLYARVLEA